MLAFSPEGSFVLDLFELVLSGLGLLVLLWIQFREPPAGLLLGIRTLTAGFAFLVIGFALRAAHCQVTISPLESTSPFGYWLLFAGESATLLAAGAIVIGCLIQEGHRRRAAFTLAITLMLTVLVALRFPEDSFATTRSIIPLTTARAAETALLLIGVGLLGAARLPSKALALLFLAIGRACALVAMGWPDLTELAWSLEHAGTLVGLILLALSLERQSRATSLRLLLRLNLAFIVLASSLILVVTEIERRQFVELSALHAQDLVEFVRGHMLYYTNRGEPAEAALTHDDVIRKLVAEFGRYPDLRRVHVSLQGRSMELSIAADGDIEQRLWIGERQRPVLVTPADFEVAPLIKLPIVSAEGTIGRVELDHSLERINQRIGWQMQLIFGVCTLFVGVASAVAGILIVAADRTIRRQYDELERTRRRLSLAERLASIGAVADGVAHEINNPAGILVARSDYVLSIIRNKPLYADIRDDVETIGRQAQRIAKTVKDLLTFTRATRLRREVFDVRSVVESAVGLVWPLIGETGPAIECRLGPIAVPVCGDRDRLEQVLTNLLTNAIHATPPSGVIGVSAAAAGGGVEIVVRDTGVGIAPEHLERIFDPFFSTKKPGRGTGLGLSIAYGIVRDHGGAIDVASTPGGGSEFRVLLPAASACVGEADAARTVVGAAAPSGEPCETLYSPPPTR